VGDDGASKVLAKTPGFDWMSPWEGRSPFKRDQEGLERRSSRGARVSLCDRLTVVECAIPCS